MDVALSKFPYVPPPFYRLAFAQLLPKLPVYLRQEGKILRYDFQNPVFVAPNEDVYIQIVSQVRIGNGWFQQLIDRYYRAFRLYHRLRRRGDEMSAYQFREQRLGIAVNIYECYQGFLKLYEEARGEFLYASRHP